MMTIKTSNNLNLLALLACLLLPFLATAQDFDNIEITTTPVRDNIYMLQGSGGNIGVSIGNDGTLIVDDQFAPLTNKIAAAIAELTDRPVNIVVNSHFHYDHTDGNENFGRAGAYIVAHDNSRKRMESTQVLAGSGRVQEAYDTVGLPKITFFDSMRFYFNGNAVDIVKTGNGHTDGDAQIYFREANVIHTGDMFVRYGLPFIDQSNGGTMDGMIDALMNIGSLIDDDTIIIPGHGQLSSRDDLLDYRAMLVVIRGKLVRAKVLSLSPGEMLESQPADGYAPPNENTNGWLLRAYEEYTGQ
ncbi:MAG TPA: MBL fold metallo-hydrolase [Gammaproteobacteria bacterium]|jgi:glyoxylase-like metal-dependent hydrolase (beta-lactamase superfamily II)|nr:MBL fold metallo-hydrolase [Gammaproteobacteria bacterium]HAT28453.1 MBL fold metallo-hydrolase [Gammaproteobacteria bacterium]HIL62728.1 MBL fold metallo-hydrolase [Porticoccaceae bacterium]|tara:strand:+ start:2464 stop:3366 length:903 start_codon:yes stop_codon:yes gene_type:complete